MKSSTEFPIPSCREVFQIIFGSSPALLGQWLAAVAAHKPGELPKPEKPLRMMGWQTLYITYFYYILQTQEKLIQAFKKEEEERLSTAAQKKKKKN